MDIYQAAHHYTSEFSGFNQKTGAPSPETGVAAMQTLVALAAVSDMPADGKLRHLDQLVGAMAEMAPTSAAVFNREIVDNPDPAKRAFAKTLETGLAAIAERSPETWEHIKHHTPLTMLYYERQTGIADGSAPASQSELLTLLVGALGHDMGKAAIDPALLHKSSRVDPERFGAALNQYAKLVPDYPEKLHDMMFLMEANAGSIKFAEHAKSPGAGFIIVDIGKDLRRSEAYWLGDEQQRQHNAIWERINDKAGTHILPKQSDGWLTVDEQQTLTMPQRGTLTPEQRKIINTHDQMSEAFFAAAPVPAELQGVREIVSMDRFRQEGAAKANVPPLADIIHTTDVLEALTANRSYRKAYTPEEALKVMDGMAKEGKVNAGIIANMRENGTVVEYASAAGLQHSGDLPLNPPPRAQLTWVEKVLGIALPSSFLGQGGMPPIGRLNGGNPARSI